ncbi:MAG: primosomal protein N', partial [Kofleriaceae bacterium]
MSAALESSSPSSDTVEVLVTLAVGGGPYHYRVPARFATRARVGARVMVRFGNKPIVGVIVRAGTPPPPDLKKLIDLTDVLDDVPALPVELVDLCLWIANYYEAAPGEVIKAALPAGSTVKAR